MTNKIKLFLCLLFFSTNMHAEVNYNSVTTVRLNGVELVNPITPKQIDDIFGRVGIAQPAVLFGCTGNYNIDINYPQKMARLEFFHEVNPKIDLSRVFSKKTLSRRYKSELKAFLWVYWEDMDSFSETLKVGEAIIKSTLTLEEFKVLFPLSYKETDNDFKKSYIENQTYHVTFSVGETKEELGDGPPYDASVQFEFKNGKLYKLAILQGVAC